MSLDYFKNFYANWAETSVVVLMLLGFFLALLMGSALISYFVIILAGFLAGRFFFTRRMAQPILPFILIIVGFLFGFTLGSVWASRLLVVVFFVASAFASYYLHQQGYLGFFKTAGFIK